MSANKAAKRSSAEEDDFTDAENVGFFEVCREREDEREEEDRREEWGTEEEDRDVRGTKCGDGGLEGGENRRGFSSSRGERGGE